MAAGPTVDLYSPASYAGDQPHDQFRWLRQHEPVHRHQLPDGGLYWAVTRHREVVEVGRDPQRYSSQATIMIDSAGSSGGGADQHVMMLMAADHRPAAQDHHG